jgi:hypothetical protein
MASSSGPSFSSSHPEYHSKSGAAYPNGVAADGADNVYFASLWKGLPRWRFLMHYVLDRPHLNDGNRLVRVQPRYDLDINQWLICDEGRYGLGGIDHDRLRQVRGPSSETTRDQALTAISARAGVIARRKVESMNMPNNSSRVHLSRRRF